MTYDMQRRCELKPAAHQYFKEHGELRFRAVSRGLRTIRNEIEMHRHALKNQDFTVTDENGEELEFTTEKPVSVFTSGGERAETIDKHDFTWVVIHELPGEHFTLKWNKGDGE